MDRHTLDFLSWAIMVQWLQISNNRIETLWLTPLSEPLKSLKMILYKHVLLIGRLSWILQLTIAFTWVTMTRAPNIPGTHTSQYKAPLIILSVSLPPSSASNDSLNLDILNCCLQHSGIWWRQPKINHTFWAFFPKCRTIDTIKTEVHQLHTAENPIQIQNQQGKSYLAWSSVAFW
jgi:hypothetical protein